MSEFETGDKQTQLGYAVLKEQNFFRTLKRDSGSCDEVVNVFERYVV
jgi:hypothetical protein